MAPFSRFYFTLFALYHACCIILLLFWVCAEATEVITDKELGCTDKPDVECSEFVTQTIGCMTLAIETRSTKIIAIALDLLTQLMKVGAVHGTFPLSKDQSGLPKETHLSLPLSMLPFFASMRAILTLCAYEMIQI